MRIQWPSTLRGQRHAQGSGARRGKRRVALFAPGIEIPLSPFMGIMAVLPPAALPNTRPPGIYGGNMDFNRLTAGASLYVPVHQPGALFYTGEWA